MIERKIIQFMELDKQCKVLCDDGTMWLHCYTAGYPLVPYWEQIELPEIPRRNDD